MIRVAPHPSPPCGHAAIPGTMACPTCPAPDDWREHAVCRSVDPELFYPEILSPTKTNEAIGVCARCPVQPYCLENGWEDQHGIWGGWTAEARRRNRSKLSRPLLRALGVQRPEPDAGRSTRIATTDPVRRCPVCGAWMEDTCTTPHERNTESCPSPE